MKALKPEFFTITDLPTDCLIGVFLFLDIQSVVQVQLTCKGFCGSVNNTAFWRVYLRIQKKSWKEPSSRLLEKTT